MNSWTKKVSGDGLSYGDMDTLAAKINPGSDGLSILPFGNGAERMLRNKKVGAHINNIDFNRHGTAHIYRAAQEGIAFAFRYGLDILKVNGLLPTVIRAGKANLFFSEIFIESFVNCTDIPVELYSNDGSVGAALGAGIGQGLYVSTNEAFRNFKPLRKIEPTHNKLYNDLYNDWKKLLEQYLIIAG